MRLRFIGILVFVLVLLCGYLLFTSLLWDKEQYTLVVGKSSSSRDIVRDNEDGCEYIKYKDGTLEPLIIDGVHVCQKGE